MCTTVGKDCQIWEMARGGSGRAAAVGNWEEEMERMGMVRKRPLIVGLTTIALAGFGLAMPTTAAPAPSGTDVTLTSGTTTKSTWVVSNSDGTTNGHPAGSTGGDLG